jgi:putative FmdB family regulatory protein
MPIYEYQCTKCHHHLEALQKFSDKPLRECPECGKHTLKRLMSAPMFRLAGSGWYETDFKSDKENKRNLVGDKGESADSGAAAKVEVKPDAKTEAKTEARPEPKKDTAPAGKRSSSRTMVTKPAAKRAARGGATRSKGSARKPARRSGKR